MNSIIFRPICLLALLIALSAASTEAASKSRCFVNEGLKNRHIVKMTIAGRSLSGVYSIEEYDSDRAQRHRFRGWTRDGVHWKIKFQGSGVPYELPPGTKEIIWKWMKRGKSESLVIKMYGKNYETNRYSAYDATFEACKESSKAPQ